MIKSKRFVDFIKAFIIPFCCISIIVVMCNFTAARSSEAVTLPNGSKIAQFHTTIDGLPEDDVTFKILATSKLSDIQYNDNTYSSGSFIPEAYQTSSIVLHGMHETKVKVELNIECTTNDDRVFYALLPNCATNQDIYAKFYSKTHGNDLTLDEIHDICNEFNTAEYTLNFDEDYLRFTLVVWSEHDAVYVDENNDGIADEDGKKLSELANGIPQETLKIKYNIVQQD